MSHERKVALGIDKKITSIMDLLRPKKTVAQRLSMLDRLRKACGGNPAGTGPPGVEDKKGGQGDRISPAVGEGKDATIAVISPDVEDSTAKRGSKKGWMNVRSAFNEVTKAEPGKPAAPKKGYGVAASVKRRMSQMLVDPVELASMSDVFQRYDIDCSGALELYELRAALADLGLVAKSQEERKAVADAIQDTFVEMTEVDFGTFILLAPQIRTLVAESRREKLYDLYVDGLDAGNGRYTMRQLKDVFHAINGAKSADEDWQKVQSLFEDYIKNQSAAIRKARGGPVTKENSSSAKAANTVSTGPYGDDFETFEKLMHAAQEKKVLERRQREWDIITLQKLTPSHVKSFREDLLELHDLFLKYDADNSGILEKDEIMQLLADTGCSAIGFYEEKAYKEKILKAKMNARGRPEDPDRATSCHSPMASSVASSRNPSPVLDSDGEPVPQKRAVRSATMPATRVELDSDQCSILKPPARKRGNSVSHAEDDDVNLGCNFVEFLTLMQMMRKAKRREMREQLTTLFKRYDTDQSGGLSLKEVFILVNHLGLQPKTKEEQAEIATILDDTDANGNGIFCLEEFENLVARISEHLERNTRFAEQKCAEDLGMPSCRWRTLRATFQEFASNGYLDVISLRSVMDRLHRRYTSEQLIEIFCSFSGEDRSCLDSLGFLKMMHAIEVKKSHGQIAGDGAPHRQNSIEADS